jgi:RNAse (barnase) inhibitor barstar
MNRTLDCLNITSEAEFWALYVRELRPDGADLFGRNLNALWDAMAGGPGWPGEGEIVLKNSGALAPIEEGQFLRALRAFDAEAQAQGLEVTLTLA